MEDNKNEKTLLLALAVVMLLAIFTACSAGTEKLNDGEYFKVEGDGPVFTIAGDTLTMSDATDVEYKITYKDGAASVDMGDSYGVLTIKQKDANTIEFSDVFGLYKK